MFARNGSFSQNGIYISIWRQTDTIAEYMVSARSLLDVGQRLKSRGVNHTILIDDVQRRIGALREKPRNWTSAALRVGHRMDWNSYPTMQIIDEYFTFLAKIYPSIFFVQTIGLSAENRPIKMVRISNNHNGTANKSVMIIAGQHCREWVAITSGLYVINEIVTKFKTQPDHVKNIDWYIIPLANPDGYVYTHARDRLWRKSRREINKNLCYGVDTNRNYGKNWKGAKFDKGKCNIVYPGRWEFSEPETQAVRDAFVKLKPKPSAFMDLHSYGQMIMYPWASDKNPTSHAAWHKNVSEGMRMAILNATHAQYSTGTPIQLLYACYGAAIDWFYDKGVNLSFAIEARAFGKHGFLLPPSEIEATGKDIMSAATYLAQVLK